MNINPEIQELENVTGLEVEPDLYTGNADSYIVYSMTERPAYWGDDGVLDDRAELSVNLYTPPAEDFMELKHKIRDYLETLGEVQSIGSWIDTWVSKSNLEVTKRHTVFTVSITKER